MKTVLVTGAAGYVGNVLVRKLLARGDKVIAFDNFHRGSCDALLGVVDHPNFKFVEGDVTNKADCKKWVAEAEQIIHLAGIVGFPACKKQPSLSYAVNVEGTRNIVEARTRDQKMFLASTGSVYGKVEGICHENSPKNYQSIYGEHKWLAEQSVTNAPNTLSYRFSTAFSVSPTMRVNLLPNDFVYQALVNRCLTVFEADFMRTFIHIKDMCDAIIFGMNREMKYKVYNCGDNKLNCSKRDLAEKIKAKTGCLVTYAEIGKDLDCRDYKVDFSKINDEGFVCQYDLDMGIDELIKAVPLLRINHQYQ